MSLTVTVPVAAPARLVQVAPASCVHVTMHGRIENVNIYMPPVRAGIRDVVTAPAVRT